MTPEERERIEAIRAARREYGELIGSTTGWNNDAIDLLLDLVERQEALLNEIPTAPSGSTERLATRLMEAE